MRAILATLVLVAVGGCAAQEPAPVVGGYNGAPFATAMAAASTPAGNLAAVEPAAGPVVSRPMLAASSKPDIKIENIPAAAPEATLPPPSILGDITRKATTEKGWRSYKVQKGDTAYRLASQFNTSTPAILAANNLDNVTQIKEGKVLMIPAGAGRFATAESLGLKPEETTGQTSLASNGPVAEAAAAEPTPQPAASKVVTGPQGTRYSLTNSITAANKPAPAPQLALAEVEPAAGPAASVSREMTSPSYTSYTVMPGDTVYRIASRYNVSVMDILNANDLDNPQDLKAGRMVRVPVVGAKATKPLQAAEVADDSGERLASLKGKIDPAAARSKGLAWPVKGTVTRNYGAQGAGVTNTGITIKTKANAPVVAAEGGTVVYAGNSLKTYGNLVLLRHKNGLVTAYAHNNALLVTKGETVKKGQTIALSGNTGNVKEPQLHFEVRKNAQAVDPLSMLQ